MANCDHLGQYVILYSERDEGGNNPVEYSDQAIILLTVIDWWYSVKHYTLDVLLFDILCVVLNCFMGYWRVRRYHS
jgi:hypothetical protein